ncbi:MAG: carbohydrate kinase family protein [Methanomassiliicoccales archaeon]|jgi:sugar/nucleoside kinase (ribokinase family)|nr:carbohydrate kinase family protein [Methanomassiliicoccales archaeon]
MRPFLTVYGHTNLDYILSLERFPERNTSVNVEEKRLYFGGTAANVATISASLGTPTALCSYVGDDLPPGFRALMEGKGVDLRDLVVVEGEATPTVWIVSDRAHDQIAYVYQGPMGRMDALPLRTGAALESEWVHVMTGRPDYYLRLMALCKEEGKKVAFDPAQELHHVWDAERFQSALSKADVLFCNENELRTALRYTHGKSAEDLLARVGMVVNTMGSRGSVIFVPGERIEVPAVPPSKVADTTGAGDAFRAGFIAGLFRRAKLRDCAVYGAAASSFVIEEKGSLTNVPSWSDVRERAAAHL